MTVAEAQAFAARWLPAWIGNQPELLAGFYSENAFYSDPAIPAGVQGKPALLAYFKKLLAHHPQWVWTQREAIPMAGGFLNLWHASIPMGQERLECDGVCLVQFDNNGLIARNEVYFDRAELLAAMARLRSAPSKQ